MTGPLGREDSGSGLAWRERTWHLWAQIRFLDSNTGGLRLKGLCTPRSSLIVAAPGRKRDVTRPKAAAAGLWAGVFAPESI